MDISDRKKIMLEVKDYTKQELADALYSSTIKPKSRLQRLRRETRGCPSLVADLHRQNALADVVSLHCD